MNHFKKLLNKANDSSLDNLISNWENVVGKISNRDEFLETASILSDQEIVSANYSLLVHGFTCSNYKFFLLSKVENYSFNGKIFTVKTYRNEFFNEGVSLGKPIIYDWCKNHKFMSPPKKTGIYFLFNEGVLVYIGYSGNIKNRIRSHYRDKYKPFDAILWLTNRSFSIREWLRFEKDLIRFWSPSLNINYVG